jgi:hypothetical protein
LLGGTKRNLSQKASLTANIILERSKNFTCPCKNTVFCFLQGIASEIPPSPETLVGWLLEHPDHALCNSDTVSSFDGLSDTDSISEEVEDLTASHTEGVILTFNTDFLYQMF